MRKRAAASKAPTRVPHWVLAGCVLAAGTGSWMLAHGAEPAHGQEHHKVCLDCHGTALYVAPDRKIKSLRALRKEVERWNDHYNPKMSGQEIEDVVAYLNETFYKFK